jgi:hypothetical protein
VDLQIVHYRGEESILDPDLETPLLASMRIQTYILPREFEAPPVEGLETVQGN